MFDIDTEEQMRDGTVTTWMGDRQHNLKPPRMYPTVWVNSAFHPSRVGQSSTNLRLGLRWGVFTCVGWQVTLCDPIWQVTPCSSEMT